MIDAEHLRAMRRELSKTAAAERVLFKGPSLLGIKSPATQTVSKLTTPKVPTVPQAFRIKTET